MPRECATVRYSSSRNARFLRPPPPRCDSPHLHLSGLILTSLILRLLISFSSWSAVFSSSFRPDICSNRLKIGLMVR